jgi:ubiquinone/menaquinone biosynthesis C-methylase UbiE
MQSARCVQPTDRVLDIGCGTGQTTRLAARQASTGHATGIDLSTSMPTVAAAEAFDSHASAGRDAERCHRIPAGR